MTSLTYIFCDLNLDPFAVGKTLCTNHRPGLDVSRSETGHQAAFYTTLGRLVISE